MARNRLRAKGRRDRGTFAALPHAILESDEYAMLSAYGVKALVDLFSQYRGANNGDLTAAWTIMERKGWRSKATLYKALRELLTMGWIVQTRQGGRHKCSLYGVTWLAINPCDNKLDVQPTRVVLGTWKRLRNEVAGPTVVPGWPTCRTVQEVPQ